MTRRATAMVLGAMGAALAAAALAAPARAGGPTMTIGVVEDAVRQPTLVATRAALTQVRLAGFDAVRLTQTWARGETSAPAWQIAQIRNVMSAARLLGMGVSVAVFPYGSSQTPLTEQEQAQFATFAASLARTLRLREVTIGNEPNLNRFWLPQFGPDGSDVAAPAFLRLLARTHDALKRVNPDIVVDGVGLSPRGGDRPGTGRDTHSPTTFIRDLGAAYRASRSTRAVMDSFDIHPYEENSSIPPAATHPRTTTIAIADYGNLETLLREAFGGTAQPASLPIVYGEFGVETTIPPDKADFYTGTEPATTHPVSPLVQGAYYRQAIALAFCQPRVRALYLLHAFDEPSRAGWQSGVYYVDRTPKPSLAIVRKAISEAERGIVARCPGLRLRPAAVALDWPHGRLSARAPIRFRLECSIDCRYTARLVRVPSGTRVATAGGRLVGRTPKRITLPRPVAPGRYRLRLTLSAPVNAGLSRRLASPPFPIRP